MIKPLKLHCFMHVPFEGPGIIENWAHEKGLQMNYTRFYDSDPLPDRSEVDMLVIMGGPMNVFDFHIHSWMQEEIEWVRKYIEEGKVVIGICLGAQIIAASLGAEVYPGEHKEIGWFSLRFLPAIGEFRIFSHLPETRKEFHWHGDTFPIPQGATRIASSSAFPNQGFIFDKRVIALQFHLEMTPDSVQGMLDNCRDELLSGPFIQSEKEILGESGFYETNQQVMYKFLDYLSSLVS